MLVFGFVGGWLFLFAAFSLAWWFFVVRFCHVTSFDCLVVLESCSLVIRRYRCFVDVDG